jgi:hypothetical protein
MLRLLITAKVVPSSPIIVTLMMEARHSSETPFLTRVTRPNIPEDVILYSDRRENLKSYLYRGSIQSLLQCRSGQTLLGLRTPGHISDHSQQSNINVTN